MRTIDARGKACPQPVILTRKALQEDDELQVIVDSDSARDNVSRMAQKAGHEVRSEQRDDGYYLHIVKAEGQAEPEAAPSDARTVILVGSDSLGRGDPQLGAVLIRGFLHALNELDHLPETMVFLNRGVQLVTAGSHALDDLCALSDKGVEILACGTCLRHYGLIGKVGIGSVSNMYSIVETLLAADKVIST